MPRQGAHRARGGGAVPEGCSLILNIGTTVEEVARALIHHRGCA
jgi:DeoR family glycerol-3-phosphate regulon repressor